MVGGRTKKGEILLMSKKTQQIAVPLISVVLGILLGAIIMWILATMLFGAWRTFQNSLWYSKKFGGNLSQWDHWSWSPWPCGTAFGFFNVGLPGRFGWLITAGWFALSFPNLPRPLMLIMTVFLWYCRRVVLVRLWYLRYLGTLSHRNDHDELYRSICW